MANCNQSNKNLVEIKFALKTRNTVTLFIFIFEA